MAIKNICSVPESWTLDEYSRHSCQDGSHHHLSFADLKRLEERNVIVWLRRGESRRVTSVVQVFIVPETRKPNVTRRPCAPGQVNFGMSNKYGEFHAKKIRQRELWALVMLAMIKRRDVAALEQREEEGKS
jgi:hypothetical protein